MSRERLIRKGPSRILLFVCLVGFVLWFGGTAAWNTRKIQMRYQCAENLIRLGGAMTAYESRYQAPPPTLDLLSTTGFVKDADLRCPAAKVPNYVYTMNAKGLENRVWVSEPMINHGEGVNVLLGDGRCTFLSPDDLKALTPTS